MWNDLRFALRLLRKNPGFAIVAVLVLGLGIGGNTAIFSIVNVALLRPLPYHDPDRLYALKTIEPKRGRDWNIVAPTDFYAIQEQARSFDGLVAVPGTTFTVRLGDRTIRSAGAEMTPDLFRLLGVDPAQGRGFTPEEYRPHSARAAVLSYDFWQTTMNGDAAVVGKQLVMDGEPHTIVGVLGATFRFPVRVDIYRPLHEDADMRRTARFLWFAFARLKPGVSIAEASAELDTISARLAVEHPQFNAGHVMRLQSLRDEVNSSIRSGLLIFQGAVALVLLIACANIGNLLIARASGRRREMAIRVAIGANIRVLARQFLIESLVLTGLGAVAGVVFASWSMNWLVSRLPVGLTFGEWLIRPRDVHIDAAALAFTAVCSTISAIAFGLAPIFEAKRLQLIGSLKRGNRRIQSALVIGEVALALTLMTAAGLLAQSFVNLQNVNPGYDPERLIHARFALTRALLPKRAQFFDQVLESARAIPGVASASFINGAPLSNINARASFSIEGRPAPPIDQQPDTDIKVITPDYFSTMQARLLRGRLLDARDNENAPAAIVVGESFAKRWWPDSDPIGARLHIQWRGFDPEPVAQIVGVVADIQYGTLDPRGDPMIYGSYRQEPWSDLELREIVIRTRSDPAAAIAALRREVRKLNPDVPVYAAGLMTDSRAAALDRPKFAMSLMSVFALVSLALASLGLYGVLAYAVTQRTKEFGIRMALGADRARLLRQVIGEGAMLSIAGVVLGVGASFGAARLLSSLLVGVEGTDVRTFIAVSGVLIFVSAAASYIPARRATRVDPMIALRQE
jgi:putative ABC transport system permease protein